MRLDSKKGERRFYRGFLKGKKKRGFLRDLTEIRDALHHDIGLTWKGLTSMLLSLPGKARKEGNPLRNAVLRELKSPVLKTYQFPGVLPPKGDPLRGYALLAPARTRAKRGGLYLHGLHSLVLMYLPAVYLPPSWRDCSLRKSLLEYKENPPKKVKKRARTPSPVSEGHNSWGLYSDSD